jgi:hypothetical protein
LNSVEEIKIHRYIHIYVECLSGINEKMREREREIAMEKKSSTFESSQSDMIRLD